MVERKPFSDGTVTITAELMWQLILSSQAKQTFFEDGVTAVPQGQSKTEKLVAIADAGQSIFIPAIGATAGMVMGEIIPGFAMLAVIFAYRAPGAFSQLPSNIRGS